MDDNNPATDFPRALAAPEGDVRVIDSTLMARTVEMARQSPRRRVILPLHQSGDETFQRMLNTLQPHSYVTPHRHKTPPKAESVIVLKGSVCIVKFSDAGEVEGHWVLRAGSSAVGADLVAGIYHTFFALEPDTVLFEAKTGPYDPNADKDFAPWAPREGSAECEEYLRELYRITKG